MTMKQQKQQQHKAERIMSIPAQVEQTKVSSIQQQPSPGMVGESVTADAAVENATDETVSLLLLNKQDPKKTIPSSSFAYTTQNLSALDGIRCIVSFMVIMYHNFQFHGLLYLRERKCIRSIFKIPFLGKYCLRMSFQMSLFWIISGYLCEYNLHKLLLRSSTNQEKNKQSNPKTTTIAITATTKTPNHRSSNETEIQQQSNNFITTSTKENQTNNDSVALTSKDYILFLLNRFLRVFPLYGALAFLVLLLDARLYNETHNRYTDPYSQTYHYCTIQEFILSLFMIQIQSVTNGRPQCVTMGWSVQSDYHGYIAMTVLFAVTYKFTYPTNTTTTTNEDDDSQPTTTTTKHHLNSMTKPNRSSSSSRPIINRSYIKKMILIGWYVSSTIYMYTLKQLPYQRLSKEAEQSINENWYVGYDVVNEYMLLPLKVTRYTSSILNATTATTTRTNDDKDESSSLYNGLYHSYNFYTPIQNEIRTYRWETAIETYSTSIHKHASSFVLGNLLYLNLYERQHQQKQHRFDPSSSSSFGFFLSFVLPLIKLGISIGLLVLVEGYYCYTGLSMYFFLDSILSMKPIYNHNTDEYGTKKQQKQQPNDASIVHEIVVPFVTTTTTIHNTNGMYDDVVEHINSFYCMTISFLSNPLFQHISQYTYGIYLFHMIFGYLRYMNHIDDKHSIIQSVTRLAATTPPTNATTNNTSTPLLLFIGDVVCDALANAGYPFTIQTLVQESLFTFALSYVTARILSILIEQPVSYNTQTSIAQTIFQ